MVSLLEISLISVSRYEVVSYKCEVWLWLDVKSLSWQLLIAISAGFVAQVAVGKQQTRYPLKQSFDSTVCHQESSVQSAVCVWWMYYEYTFRFVESPFSLWVGLRQWLHPCFFWAFLAVTNTDSRLRELGLASVFWIEACTRWSMESIQASIERDCLGNSLLCTYVNFSVGHVDATFTF